MFSSEWGFGGGGGGGVVKCIIYPCLPLESGTHKRVGLLPECSRQRCLEGLARSQELAFFLFFIFFIVFPPLKKEEEEAQTQKATSKKHNLRQIDE